MSFNIEIQSGTTARLLVGGKYCDRDIVVTAKSNDLAKQIIERTITRIDDESIVNIGTYAFAGCESLSVVILRSTTMATLENANAFESTPIADGTGYIYVPAELVDGYKENWSTYADQIRAIEDYPDICETETNLGGTE